MENTRTISYSRAIAWGIVILAVGLVLGFQFASSDSLADSTSPGQPENVDFSPVWKAWGVIDDKFVPASVASTTVIATSTADINQERVWGLIAGLAASLNDPYTYFLPPAENEDFNEEMSGRFEGVGMEIANRDKVLTVVTPLKGTPAERAGIRSGDKILQIDGVDASNMEVNAAIKKIRGPKGTQVVLLIARESWTEPREIKVTRDIINVPVITTTVREDGVYVIALSTFTANSQALFRDALREFIKSGKSKLVLDLRGNPGGYLEAAVDMASWFLPSGAVVVTEDYAGNAGNIVHRSRGYDIFNENLRMVVLVDRGSASASEILADALHFHKKAQLVGTNTFGKGSVQELVEITPGTSLKITVARWLGPSGRQIPLEGIKPDVEVKLTEEDIKAKKDPQLEKAAAILNAMQ